MVILQAAIKAAGCLAAPVTATLHVFTLISFSRSMRDADLPLSPSSHHLCPLLNYVISFTPSSLSPRDGKEIPFLPYAVQQDKMFAREVHKDLFFKPCREGFVLVGKTLTMQCRTKQEV